MLRTRGFVAAAFLALGLVASVATALPSYIAFPSDVDWRVRDSKHFSILYRKGSDDLAVRALRVAERSRELLSPVFPDLPDKTYIVLADFKDSTNGYGLDFPWPHMVLFAAPPDANEALGSLDDWFASIILHEYVHILHLYPTRGMWTLGRKILGSYVVPIGLMPTHFHEGLATFLETELTRGGRGRGALFSAWKRAKAIENRFSLEAVPLDLLDGSALRRHPHGASPYFYGYYLYRELWSRKGAEGVRLLTEKLAGNYPYFLEKTRATSPAFRTPFQEVYGEDPEALWRQTFAKGTEEAKKEAESVGAAAPAPERWTEDAFGKWNVVAAPDGKRLAYRSGSPDRGPELVLYDAAGRSVLHREPIEGGKRTGMCWGKRGDDERILLLDLLSRNQNTYGTLRAFDPVRRRWSALEGKEMPLERFHTMGCSADLSRIVVYTEVAGEGALLELEWVDDAETAEGRPSRTLTVTRRWPVARGSWITAITVGEYAFATLRSGVTTMLFRWKPGEEKPKEIARTGALVTQLLPHPVAKSVFAVADFDGRMELWRVDANGAAGTEAKGGTATRHLAIVTGIDSVAATAQGWTAIVLGENGSDLMRVEQTPTKRLVALSASLSKAPSWVGKEAYPVTKERPYSAWGTVFPQFWIPSVLFVPDGLQGAVFLTGFDLSQRHVYTAVGGYDTRGSPFASVDYAYRFHERTGLNTSLFYAPNYIVSARAFQRLWGGGVSLTNFLPLGELLHDLGIAYVTNEATPPRFPEFNRGVGIRVGLGWARRGRTRPVDVTTRDFTRIGVSHTQYLAAIGSSNDYYLTTLRFEQAVPIPFTERHSLYLRVQAGITENARRFVFSFFQGGGELLFDTGRANYLNRGYLPGTFLGQRIFATNLEWRFPLLDVDRGHRYVPAFLRRLHGAVTFDAITTDRRLPDYEKTTLFHRVHASVGFELKSDWLISYYLPAQIRLGAYRGLDEFGERFYWTAGLEASL
jgi:predicted Fe-Mo cluster-binding NifX family protein